MKDKESGSIWQQVSGKAIFGRMKGHQLNPIYWDELTFARWKQENPSGRVLSPKADIAAANLYAKSDWETEIGKLPVASPHDQIFPPRTIILGIQIGNTAKAYPLSLLSPGKPIVDRIGATSIVLCMAEDKKSVRCFDTRLKSGVNLELFAKQGSPHMMLTDSATGSDWDFRGIVVSGSLKGEQLKRIEVLKDYWFDWKNYHPNTLIYKE